VVEFNKQVRESAKSIKVAFDNFDKDNSGFLEFFELGHLVHSLVPSFTHRCGRGLLCYKALLSRRLRRPPLAGPARREASICSFCSICEVSKL
jgi:hypothetical protein